MKTETIMWLLPIVFMIHDFEEVIMFKPWIDKNAGFLKKNFPRLAARMLPDMEGLSTSSFALAVALMFLIVSTATLIAVEFGLYALWAGALIGYFVHLIIHLGQFVVFRRYVPVVITSFVTAPYCVWALVVINNRHPLPAGPTLFWSGAALVVIAGALFFVHALAARFERWLKVSY
ncbi:MAG: HXXEE domain-containing protein [Deltaproteobacteria bacterium]|nr:HXXEE domain-containing protein [Candidatus Zymogenaceae bacterium]